MRRAYFWLRRERANYVEFGRRIRRLFGISGAVFCRAVELAGLRRLAAIFFLGVVSPLLDYERGQIVCDDEGLVLGLLWSKRRVAFAEIEALFLLTTPDEPENEGIPALMVNGKPLTLEVCEPTRAQLLGRIERNVGGALRFYKRDSIPMGSAFALPKTFDYRTDPKTTRLSKIIAVCATLLNLGIIALLLWRAGTQPAPPHLLALWCAVALEWNFGRQKQRRERELAIERRGESIVVDEAGLRLLSPTREVRLNWEQITRLERDCTQSQWNPIYCVEGAGKTVTFQRFYQLAELLRERCGLYWQETPHFRRLAYGIAREGETLSVRADTEKARMQNGVCWLGWRVAATIIFWIALWNPAAPWSAIGAALLKCLLPPWGLLLYLAVATTIARRRIVTVCDDNGLTHWGWLAPRTIKWSDIEAHGKRALWIWVRTRDGKTLRIASWPLGGNARARRELHAEIERRAPHAQSD